MWDRITPGSYDSQPIATNQDIRTYTNLLYDRLGVVLSCPMLCIKEGGKHHRAVV